MITTLTIFLFASLVSFIGSLQLGPVNLFVINAALFKDNKTALLIAIGGSIPELMYCSLAVYASSFFGHNPLFQYIFKVVFIVILISIGFTFLFKKNNVVVAPEKPVVSNSMTSFFKGFSLATLNPQLLPFWIFVQVYFNTICFLQIKSKWDSFSFILGSGVGALMLLITIIIAVNKYKMVFLSYVNNKYYFKVLSVLFFLIALQQLISLFYTK